MNSSKSVACAISIGVVALTSISWLVWRSETQIPDIWIKALYFSLLIAGLFLYGFLTNPIKHEYLVMYGKRPWWGNILLFGLLPMLFISAVLYILVRSNVGI